MNYIRPDKNNLSVSLKLERLIQNLSQEQISKDTGLNSSKISRIESNITNSNEDVVLYISALGGTYNSNISENDYKCKYLVEKLNEVLHFNVYLNNEEAAKTFKNIKFSDIMSYPWLILDYYIVKYKVDKIEDEMRENLEKNIDSCKEAMSSYSYDLYKFFIASHYLDNFKYKEAFEIIEKLKSKSFDYPLLDFHECFMLFVSSKYMEALMHIYDLKIKFRIANNLKRLIVLSGIEARCLSQQGQNCKADEVFVESIRLCRTFGFEDLKKTNISNYLLHLHISEDYEKIIELHNEYTIKDFELLRSNYFIFGMAYCKQGDYELASEVFETRTNSDSKYDKYYETILENTIGGKSIARPKERLLKLLEGKDKALYNVIDRL